MIFLPDAEDCTTVFSFVGTKQQNVTDGQTDRQNRSGYYSGLHCEQCGCAINIFTLSCENIGEAMKGR